MSQPLKGSKKKRKLPKDITERPDHDVMEKLFGKKVVKELDKLTERAKKPAEPGPE